ncbi:hypothetical protein TNCV_3689121 [Trichonephila clavipes]|uniref:Uncharacterized protein n=1 Tax=Trichonephila clavipes TaxID=2585209 RepID=A0A8X6VQ85_TRICX|nr:hypothetical protein TNCV_3689121 [Trichonephila clavipes]
MLKKLQLAVNSPIFWDSSSCLQVHLRRTLLHAEKRCLADKWCLGDLIAKSVQLGVIKSLPSNYVPPKPVERPLEVIVCPNKSLPTAAVMPPDNECWFFLPPHAYALIISTDTELGFITEDHTPPVDYTLA